MDTEEAELACTTMDTAWWYRVFYFDTPFDEEYGGDRTFVPWTQGGGIAFSTLILHLTESTGGDRTFVP